MKLIFTLIFVSMLLCGMVCADEAKLPVFYLKYDSSLVSEETEEDIEQSAVRHTVSLRIKEQFSRVLTTNLLTSFSRKQYRLEKGSYSYVAVNPYVSWDVTDKVRIFQGFRSKWICYDEPDSEGLSKDFTSLLFDTRVIFKPIEEIKITPSVKGTYDLFENDEKTRQTYRFGMAVDTKIDGVKVGGRYRAITRLPLKEESEVDLLFTNEFGVSVSWDPNK
jgi:hypothetical protein